MSTERHHRKVGINSQQGCLILITAMVFIAILTLKNTIIEFNFIDPYFYTGLIHDYRQTLERYGTTYYANRVAFTVPARLIVGWFGDGAGHAVLKIVDLGAISLSAFALGRRYYSRGAGVAAAGWAAFNPWIIRALDWDYVDGVAITYGTVGFCCFLAPRERKTLFHALGGGVLAFGCNTNAFMFFLAMTLIPSWLLLQSPEGLLGLGRLAIAAVLGFIAGYAIVCLIQFAEFPKLGFGRELRTIVVGLQLLGGAQTTWFQPLSEIMRPGTAYLLMPPALFIAVAAVSAILSRETGVSRFAVAALAFLLSTYGLFVVFHYGLHSGVLTHFFYFSYLFPPTLFVVIALLGEVFARLQQRFVVLACAATILCFGFMWVGFDALRVLLTDQSASTLILSALVVGFVLVISPLPSIRAVGAIAACILSISVFYNEASVLRDTPYYGPQAGDHLGEYAVLHSRGEAKLEHDAYEGAVFLQHVVAATLPLTDGPVGFWYGSRPDGILFSSVQSIFLYAYSNIISPELPHDADDRIDAETRRKLAQFRHLVILTRGEREGDMAVQALAADGSTVHVRATVVYPGRLLSYHATFVDVLPAPATVGDEVARLPNAALTAQNGGNLIVQGDAIRLMTDRRQWTYSAGASLAALNLPARPFILRLSAVVSKGQIGVMVLDKASSSTMIGETSSVPVGDPQVIDVDIPDGSRAADLILRNVATGTSTATITAIVLYDAPTAKAP